MGNKVFLSFMELFRAGLWSLSPDLGLFPLTMEEWGEIRMIGQKQTITAILYDGMLLLPQKLQPSFEILLAWTAEVDFIERKNHKMNQVIAELSQFFNNGGISIVLLKGQGLAALYNQPAHRMSGDIDWYIPSSADRVKAKKLLKEKGHKLISQAGSSFAYFWGGIPIEHHDRLIDSHNPFIWEYLKSLEKEESDKSESFFVEGESILLPSLLLSHLQVNMHILKHMLSFGIGFRQVCDLAYLYRSFPDMTDGKELEAIYRKMGIYQWIQVLHELLVRELGLDEKFLPFARESGIDHRWMMNEIWESGNFGYYDCRFGGHKDDHRQHTIAHWFHRFKLQLSFAPEEVCWFPIYQLFSRFLRCGIRSSQINISGIYI